jgi:hypothetical protein
MKVSGPSPTIPATPPSDPPDAFDQGTRSIVSTVLLIAAVVLAVVNGSRGILKEDALSAFDMPRYLMNGVFLRDFLAAGPPLSMDRALAFASDYYARYPALSLGHHPPLLPVLLVPAYAIFGVSVFSARLVIVGMFVIAVLALYGMGRRLYGTPVGAWAAALFATHPAIVAYAQQVMSETPMLALMLVAGWQLAAFTRTGKARHYAGFAAAVTLSLYARQFAVFAFPAYAVMILVHGQWRRLLRRDVLAITAVAAVLMAPIVPLTTVMSRFNVSVVTGGVGHKGSVFQIAIERALADNLGIALWLGVPLALAYGLWRARRLIWVPLTWAAVVVGTVAFLTGTIEPERYALGSVPGFCLLAATLAAWRGDRRVIRVAASVILSGTLVVQTIASVLVQPAGLSGYATAVRWILANSHAPTVLFDGPVDTGYFSFFLRKYDTQHKLVMLRADKLFATSLMSWHGLTPKIDRPEAIDPILHRYGTQFVVLEDVPSPSAIESMSPPSQPLIWLREELKTPRFAERMRLPLNSVDPLFRGVSLVVYEYLDATPPDPHAVLDLDLPLIGRKVIVPLQHLIDGTGPGGRMLDMPDTLEH